MEIIILGLLILLNGFFALSEIALVSSKKTRLEHLSAEGKRGAKTALQLLDNSENFLSSIQIGITLIGIITGVYGGLNIADDVSPFFQNIEFTKNYADGISLTVTVIIITYISIVIGELVPKTIAMSNPEKIAVRVAPVIYYFSAAFFPFVKILSVSTNFVNRLLRIRKYSEKLSESEIRQLIHIASTEGVIEKEQKIIHEKVFYFSDKKAKHIMTHRTEVEWINLDEPDELNYKFLSEVNHSRVVCAQGHLDNFRGLLYLRDFYKTLAGKSNFSISDLLIQPVVVKEETDAQKVLNILKQNKTHICCVVNEHGGFEGIITLHDIIENIVGHIPEEGETDEPYIFVRDDNSILISGDAPVELLAEIIDDFEIDFETIDYSTVAGFVFSKLTDIPQIGDRLEHLGYRFEIVDIDGIKIDKLLVTKKSSL
ncbi:MAG: HlyC/CorC family transporter [Ignavibacteria bacterium]|nr:HlyC/CorC family transporter [Ignavibacteria bacterium]